MELEKFIEDFCVWLDYSMLGIYRRQALMTANETSLYVPALLKACAMGAFMNRKYDLRVSGRWAMPEAEYQLYRTLANPLAELVDSMPPVYRDALIDRTCLYDMDPLVEMDGKGGVVWEQDGYLLMENPSLYHAKDVKDQMREYNGQVIFEELCRGDYRANRHFLEQPENTYIPGNAIDQSVEQRQFIQKNEKLFSLCYENNLRPKLYRCKCCGMVLREKQQDIFSCVSKKCNSRLDEKQLIETKGTGYVLRDVVARNIYYPGILEQQIKKILDHAVTIGTVQDYTIWPGIDEYHYDTWDFDVRMKDGRRYVIDAKDVENPHWLIWDERTYVADAKFLYVVPNDKKKSYITQINQHDECIGKVQCIRLKELKQWMEA